MKFRPFDKVERCFDIVAQNGNIVEATGNKAKSPVARRCCFDNAAASSTGRNRTCPPCSVGHPTTHAPGRWRADRPRARRPAGPYAGSITDDDSDRRQRAKQYWPIRLASNNGGVCFVFLYYKGVSKVRSGNERWVDEHDVTAKQTHGKSQGRGRLQPNKNVVCWLQVVYKSEDSRRLYDGRGTEEIEESAVQSFLASGHLLLR